jgi:hypothetical protein
MGKWIFQDIKDIHDEVFNSQKGESIGEKIVRYNKRLREKISPEIYVRYCIWQCDIYVDVFSIIVATQNVYPNVTKAQIECWIEQHKEQHHCLTY